VPPGVQLELKPVCEVPLRLRMRCNGGVTSCNPSFVLLRDFVRVTSRPRATEQYKWKQPPESPPRQRQVGKSDLPRVELRWMGIPNSASYSREKIRMLHSLRFSVMANKVVRVGLADWRACQPAMHCTVAGGGARGEKTCAVKSHFYVVFSTETCPGWTKRER
jgi:hypothetical protein